MYTFIRINKKIPKEFRNILECDKIPGLPVRTGAWHGGFGGHPVGAEIDNRFLVIASGRWRYRGLLSLVRDGVVSGIMVGAVIPFLANKAAPTKKADGRQW